jgi:hypothetical protein
MSLRTDGHTTSALDLRSGFLSYVADINVDHAASTLIKRNRLPLLHGGHATSTLRAPEHWTC